MKKLYAVLTAVLLGAGGVVGLGVAPASAHTPSITASCSGVVLTASAYDGNKANTWDVNIGGVEQSGTFGSSLEKAFPVPQDGATTHVTATIADADSTPAYTQTLDQQVGPCGTAPKVPATITVDFPTATAPSCDAAGSVTPDFTQWTPAENANGYEGDGYHLYVSPAYTGPGTYTFTAYRIGGAGNAAYPNGTLFSDGNGGTTKGPLTATITVLPQESGIDCTAVPPVTHRSTDIFDEVVCDATGGGNQTETVTNYTSRPVWNEDTQAYDMVESVDADNPIVTNHVIVASADQCPEPAAVVTTPKTPTTVTKSIAISPASDVLADTGSEINNLVVWVIGLIAAGLIALTIVAIARRRKA